MTPEERELRQALIARGGHASPQLRARISSALSGAEPAPGAPRLIAIFVAAALTIVTVGALVMARHSTPPTAGGTATAPRVRSPLATPIPMPNTAQLSVPSRDVVWVFVADRALYRSVNRGETWVQRPIPTGNFALPEMSFVDNRVGWLTTGGSPETQCNGAGTQIFHTTDAGESWQLVALLEGAQPTLGSGLGYAQCKQGLSFVDSNHGFLNAWDPNHQATIYRTSDGGRTWAGATLPDPPGFKTQPGGDALRAGLVRGFGSTLLVSARGMQPAAESEVEYVFRSTDGGATWTYLATIGNEINSVSFVTSSRWLQIENNGQALETTNAGQTWHPYATDYADAAGVPSTFVFGDQMVGYGTVRGGIFRTVDGGRHWLMIRTPGT